jgi:ribosomal protein S18 acetylase RimI-like enzyme
MIAYRQMSVEDIPAGLSLCRSAGWNQVASDWELFLQLSPNGCKVAIDEGGKVVGTVTTVRYQEHFSWIGMVLVDPEQRRRGIGTRLLQEALSLLKDEETVKLDATPTGREVYLQLGFIDECPLTRLQLSSRNAGNLPKSNATPMQPDDFEAIKLIDEKVFGGDRSVILKRLLDNAPQLAFVTRTKNGISGFCFGRQGHNFIHIGPVVSTNEGEAQQLVLAAIKNCERHSIILDAPNRNAEWNNLLASIGFTVQRPFIRMQRGKNNSPGITENQFAILGPEFG